MVQHPLTETGIQKFRKDWEAAQSAVATDEAVGLQPVAG
jgi:transaldolase